MKSIRTLITDRKGLIVSFFSILILIIPLCFFAPHIKNLKVLVSIKELVDKNLPSSKNYQNLKNEFELKNSLLFILKPKTRTWKNDDPRLIDNWIRAELSSNENVASIISPFTFYKPSFMEPNYIHYYKMVNPDDKNINFTEALKKFNKGPWKNIITNLSGNEFTFELHLEDAPPPQKFGSFNPKSIDGIISSINQKLGKYFEIYITGSAIYTYYAFKGVQYNFLLNFLFLIIVLVVFKALFGTIKCGLFLVFSFVWVGVLIHGIMAYFNLPMEILSSGLFIMIAVASIEDYFFILHENLKGNSLNEVFKRLRVPSFLTSFTTIVGFGSLYFTDIDIVGRFGVMAAIGALLEWVAVFIVLPGILNILNIKNLTDVKKSKLIESNFWKDIIKKITPNKKFGYISFILYPLSILVLFNFSVSDSPLSLFSKNHKINKDFSFLKNSRDWEGQSSLIFPLDISDNEQKEIIYKVGKLSNVKHIEDFFSVNKFLIEDIPSRFQSAVVADFKTSSLIERYKSEYFSKRHLLYFNDTNFQSFKITKNEIEKICNKKCSLVGELISYVEFMDKIPLGFMKSLGLSLLFVSLILLIMALKVKFPKPFSFVLSSLWGPAVLLLLMWVFSVKINFLSCVFVTLMVGVTGDNGIQFLYAHKENSNGIEYHEKCALQMGLLLCIMCFMFTLSYFEQPKEFGPLMAIGFLCSLFGDICLTKSFLEKD